MRAVESVEERAMYQPVLPAFWNGPELQRSLKLPGRNRPRGAFLDKHRALALGRGTSY